VLTGESVTEEPVGSPEVLDPVGVPVAGATVGSSVTNPAGVPLVGEGVEAGKDGTGVSSPNGPMVGAVPIGDPVLSLLGGWVLLADGTGVSWTKVLGPLVGILVPSSLALVGAGVC
jgi:hypothetical protein